ncbi:DUF5610 domain-containing protein [Candidatus Latescibacterota bacterium]
MLISAPSTTGASLNDMLSNGIVSARETKTTTLDLIQLSYQDQNSSAVLTLSSITQSREATYTSQGVMGGNTSKTPLSSAGIDRGESQQALALQQNYLTSIQNRVSYLLSETAKIINGGSPSLFQPQQSAQENINVLSVNDLQSSASEPVDIEPYSPENTANRILQFAMSFYDGGDREEFANMVKEAVLKGYDEAMEALGGMLPQEADETISLVIQALDNFAEGNPLNISI